MNYLAIIALVLFGGVLAYQQYTPPEVPDVIVSEAESVTASSTATTTAQASTTLETSTTLIPIL
ncbi:MAG: hypothetical protein R3B69_04055 [Candidatus Paceibacterota bacterium]